MEIENQRSDVRCQLSALLGIFRILGAKPDFSFSGFRLLGFRFSSDLCHRSYPSLLFAPLDYSCKLSDIWRSEYIRTLKRIYFRALAAILVARFAIGCSYEAKKSGSLKRADRYFASGDYDKANIEYSNVLRADPQNATAIQRLGTIWYEQGAPLRAAPFLIKTREFVTLSGKR